MFFYTSLFVGSLIAAFLILYLYNALIHVGKTAYRAWFENSEDHLTGHLDEAKYGTTPWGWKSHATPGTSARTHPAAATPNAAGFDDFLNSNLGASGSQATQKSTASWPYREEKSETSGKAYKVSRKARPPRTNLKETAKPWGW